MKQQVRFFLKEPHADRETPVNAQMYFGGERLKVATGILIHPKNWLPKQERARRTAPLAAPINDTLTTIKGQLSKVVADLMNSGVPLTPSIVRERYQELRNPPPPTPPEEPVNFLQTYDTWINGQHFTAGTRRNHRKAKNHIAAFAKTQNIDLAFDTFDRLFWSDLVTYLLTTVKMSNDSAWNVTKSIKAFMADSYEKGFHTNQSFMAITKKKTIPHGDTNTDHEYLTEQELNVVIALDLSDAPRLARVRDLFVFTCLTGTRFGDTQQLGPENEVNGDLVFNTTKNRKEAHVPLLPESLRIWRRYKGRLPHLSNQKANDFLELALERASKVCPSLAAPVTSVRYRGTDAITTTLPKYKAIGMHCGKRTFVSLMLSRGMTLETLARATGNTVATLQRYDVRSGATAAKLLRAAWGED